MLVFAVSTYALTLCCVGTRVALFELIVSSSTHAVIPIVPSLNVPNCTVPLNVPLTPWVILPEFICKVPSVTVTPVTVALPVIFWLTCKLLVISVLPVKFVLPVTAMSSVTTRSSPTNKSCVYITLACVLALPILTILFPPNLISPAELPPTYKFCVWVWSNKCVKSPNVSVIFAVGI